MNKLTTRALTLGLAAVLTAGGTLLAAPAFAEEPATDAPVVTETNAPAADEVMEDLPTGTVTLTGAPLAGTTATVSSEGWPEGTTLTYEWFYSGGQFGGPISDLTGIEQTETSYVIDNETIGLTVGVIVYGELEGYNSTYVNALFETAVSTPQLPTAGAPVADSSGLSSYLVTKGVTPVNQTDAGLPAEALAPGTDYTANIFWGSGDSFVDVYAFSTPTLIGTFPIVDGVAQVTLSGATLAAIGAGAHTLVVTGQTSGNVQAVNFTVAAALAATGSTIEPAPFALAGILSLLGGALVLARRRANA